MVQAPVGFHCPDCVKQAARAAPVYTANSLPVTRPIVTYLLIGLNVAAFIADIATNYRFTGGARTRGVPLGVLFGPSVADGEWWRLFTAGFFHFSVFHIGMNMFVLWRIGTQIESMLGTLRYISLYLASLFAGSLGAMLLTPGAFTAGASGAIFGLLGAAAAYQLTHRINMWQSGLAMLIGLNLVITFAVPGISVGGHVGGLIGGTVCGYAMFQLEERRQSPWVGVALAAGLALLCIGVAVLSAPAVTRQLL